MGFMLEMIKTTVHADNWVRTRKTPPLKKTPTLQVPLVLCTSFRCSSKNVDLALHEIRGPQYRLNKYYNNYYGDPQDGSPNFGKLNFRTYGFRVSSANT